ncbi:MAG: hypothetical protein FWD93_00440 [Coriobacteriia bacterium]|nr:hypothetical protein [Coriobacteriia bacterium]
MRTLTGSDGCFYRNELCFDETDGEMIALRDIRGLGLNKSEKVLFAQWEMVLICAKNERTDDYNSALTCGVYQIFAELNTKYKDEVTGKTVWDNVELNSALTALKKMVAEYYNTEIVPTLFQYELLK